MKSNFSSRCRFRKALLLYTRDSHQSNNILLFVTIMWENNVRYVLVRKSSANEVHSNSTILVHESLEFAFTVNYNRRKLKAVVLWQLSFLIRKIFKDTGHFLLLDFFIHWSWNNRRTLTIKLNYQTKMQMKKKVIFTLMLTIFNPLKNFRDQLLFILIIFYGCFIIYKASGIYRGCSSQRHRSCEGSYQESSCK